MKYEFVEENRSAFGVEKMCEALKVSRSGYYAWRRCPVSRRRNENAVLLPRIRESYIKSRGTYGSPRITEDLREAGIRCGKNRIARLMRDNGIVAKTKRRFKATTDSRHNLPVAENLLRRRFRAESPNRVWVSDITYVWTQEGWLYLAMVLDIYSRKVVGWAMEERITTDLALKALERAVWRRKPVKGLIFHSDRGSQYASEAFREALKGHGFLQSMSAKGDCYDNAVAESFFNTLKTEHVYHERFTTRSEARRSIFEYIEAFYNSTRRHSTLGQRSPLEFERDALAA